MCSKHYNSFYAVKSGILVVKLFKYSCLLNILVTIYKLIVMRCLYANIVMSDKFNQPKYCNGCKGSELNAVTRTTGCKVHQGLK